MPSSQKEDGPMCQALVPACKWKPSTACASPFSCDVLLKAGGVREEQSGPWRASG